MVLRISQVALMLACGLFPALAGTVSASKSVTVVGVHDGDTCTVRIADGTAIKVRPASMDAPELGQPWGRQSKEPLSSLVFGRRVTLISHGKDRYGRVLGDLLADGLIVNRYLVECGAAWRYPRYSRFPALRTAQMHVTQALAGLWALPSPVPPWDGRSGRSAVGTQERR